MISSTKPKDFDPQFDSVSCFIESDGEFLLLHRQDNKPQGNTWGMPAGKIDSGEDIESAVIREIYEETGLDIQNPQYFKEVYVRYPEYDFTYHMFYINLDNRVDIRINSKEHKDFAWVTPENSLEMNLIGGLKECILMFYFNK